MTEYNSLEKIRLQKLEELRAEGIEAYPTRANAPIPVRRPLLHSKPPRRKAGRSR